ncbi:MAG: agmatine deiminase family protein [Candidatus Sumerlaeaceae bacterium]
MTKAYEPTQVPAAAGFCMPPEWDDHEATWIAWPHNVTDWPGKFHPIPWVFAEVVKHISEDEEVRILVADTKMEHAARRTLARADALRGKITFYHVATNRCWTRDSLPTFVVNPRTKTLGAVKWRFNAWAKYDDWWDDDRAGEIIAKAIPECCWFPRRRGSRQRIVLEGGAIDVNGQGLVLATEECLLSATQERNPGLSRTDYEEIFAEYLGASETLWLAGGIVGDDTHGHIDDVARFVAHDKIVVAVETHPDEHHYEILRQNVKRLQSYRNSSRRDLEVIEVPLPRPVYFAGQRLPASYSNFYITNRKVLVPTFNDPNDRIALNVLQSLFGDRTVVGIYCLDLVLGLGTLHCMTQQQPRA